MTAAVPRHNGDLPEPLTLRPVLADVGRTVALCQRFENQDSEGEYASL